MREKESVTVYKLIMLCFQSLVLIEGCSGPLRRPESLHIPNALSA